MREHRWMRLVLLVLLALAACSKDRPKPPPPRDVAPRVDPKVQKIEKERAEASELRSAIEGMEGPQLSAGPLGRLMAALRAPPGDADARATLVRATAALGPKIITAYLLSEAPPAVPEGLSEGLSKLSAASDLLVLYEAFAKRAAAMKAPDPQATKDLDRGWALLKRFSGVKTDIEAHRILRGLPAATHPEAPALAVAFGARAAGDLGRHLKAEAGAAKLDIVRREVIPLGCEKCGGERGVEAALEIPVEQGGLACAGKGGDTQALIDVATGCALPEALRKDIPAAVRDRFDGHGIAVARGVQRLWELAQASGIPDELRVVAARAQDALVGLDVQLGPGVIFGNPLEEASKRTVFVAASTGSGALLAEVPPRTYVVGPAGVFVVERVTLAVSRDGPGWRGGAEQRILTARGLPEEAKDREHVVGEARMVLRRAIGPGTDGAGEPTLLAVDVRVKPALVSDALEVWRDTGLTPPRLIAAPGPGPRGIPVWLVGLGERPAGVFDELREVEVAKDYLRVAIPNLPEPPPAPATANGGPDAGAPPPGPPSPPEGVKVRVVGKRKAKHSVLLVPDLPDAPAYEKVPAALDWVDEVFGKAWRFRVDGRRRAPEVWQQLAAAFSHGRSEEDGLDWIRPRPVSAVPGPTVPVRPVALRLFLLAAKEKPKGSKPPRPERRPIGFCDKADIQRVMRSRMGAFKFCYERRLQINPDLEGKLTARFTIGEDGRVESARALKSTLRDREVAPCILKNVKKVRFARPQGGVCVVNWPFVFTR